MILPGRGWGEQENEGQAASGAARSAVPARRPGPRARPDQADHLRGQPAPPVEGKTMGRRESAQLRGAALEGGKLHVSSPIRPWSGGRAAPLDAQEVLQRGGAGAVGRRRGRSRSNARESDPKDRASSRRPGCRECAGRHPIRARRPASASRWWPNIRSSRSATSKAAWLNFGAPVPSRNRVW